MVFHTFVGLGLLSVFTVILMENQGIEDKCEYSVCFIFFFAVLEIESKTQIRQAVYH